MKSQTINLRSRYCMMIDKRSPNSQILMRQKMVRYAQEHGTQSAARFNCGVRTVWEWRLSGALESKSRTPHSCPHKTPKEAEAAIISKRKSSPCYRPKRLKYFYCPRKFKMSLIGVAKGSKKRALWEIIKLNSNKRSGESKPAKSSFIELSPIRFL
jgi:hypothetical protein